MVRKTILITGATGGIGQAVARAFAKAKWEKTIVLTDHDSKLGQLSSLCYAMSAPGKKYTGYRWFGCDISQNHEIESAIKSCFKQPLDKIDVLINIAGIAPKKMMPLVKTDDDEAEKIMRVNYWGTRNMCKAVLPLMRANGYGRIINVASISALMPDAGNIDYSASKAAVVQLTRGLAIEAPKNVKDDLHPYDITVNAVAPGIVATEMAKQLSESMIESFKVTAPLRRLMTPEDVARAIFWLASKDADAINGVVLRVDGGFLA